MSEIHILQQAALMAKCYQIVATNLVLFSPSSFVVVLSILCKMNGMAASDNRHVAFI